MPRHHHRLRLRMRAPQWSVSFPSSYLSCLSSLSSRRAEKRRRCHRLLRTSDNELNHHMQAAQMSDDGFLGNEHTLTHVHTRTQTHMHTHAHAHTHTSILTHCAGDTCVQPRLATEDTEETEWPWHAAYIEQHSGGAVRAKLVTGRGVERQLTIEFSTFRLRLSIHKDTQCRVRAGSVSTSNSIMCQHQCQPHNGRSGHLGPQDVTLKRRTVSQWKKCPLSIATPPTHSPTPLASSSMSTGPDPSEKPEGGCTRFLLRLNSMTAPAPSSSSSKSIPRARQLAEVFLQVC